MVGTLSVFTLLSLGALAVAQTPACVRNYTVVPGDICINISAKTSTSTFQLANANVGVIDADCTNLVAGEVICLGRAGQDCRTTTVVESGDVCVGIAAAAGIPLSLLLHNNPNVDSQCSNIFPNEVLCTSSQTFNYT